MLQWLKRSVPSNLYGRAALILVVPVITLQLVVTISFLQRHFENVTEQLTEGLALEIAFLRDELAAGVPFAQVVERAALMQINLSEAGSDVATQRGLFDISGLTVIATLTQDLQGYLGADLVSQPRGVTVFVASDTGADGTVSGPLAFTMARDRVAASNPHQLLVLTVFVGVLMTFVAYAFLRNQLRPITRLSAAAEAFGKGRTIPYRPAGAVEVQAAGHAFLDMRDRIERQIEQRTRMLSGVSHDLRTPLTRMKLELSLLDPAPEVEALEKDVAEMEALLEAFLAFARGDATEKAELCDPKEMLATAVDRARRAGGQVDWTAPEQDLPLISARPVAIGRALDNLLVNARRYAHRADVSVELAPSHIRLIVQDDGPGIPAASREEAMRPFARLDTARNQDKGSGVGLGLSIALDIAQTHGGRLVLDDSPTLGGLRAALVLPK